MKIVVIVLVLSLAGLTACSQDRPAPAPTPTVASATPSADSTPSVTPSPSPNPTPKRSPTPTPGGCANEAAIALTPNLLIPGSLRGDVDGDGKPDTVRIALDPSGANGCRAFVVVRLDRGSTVTAPIP
ncbi:MAG: hypothetical protein M3P01_04420, partial [Actinomycetota bacterium]|nr:hypothetical protein [Actinomycetota bacterium]